jgi:20S proteasome alpha/beta subunit
MTIAVGAKYPWGNLNRLPPTGIKIPEAIILASDSRFSRVESGDHILISDVGAKLFPLGNDCAVVYAGISAIGELCFDELRWRLAKESNPNSIHSKSIAEKTFNSVYRQQVASMKLKPEDAPLYILIGACNKHGQAELYKASYASNFRLEPVSGLNVVAWEDTRKSFDNFLSDELDKQVEEELSLRKRFPEIPMASLTPMPIDAQQVAILIVASISRAIEKGMDTTIGGMVQCAVITTEGVVFPEISYTSNGTNKGPGWTRETANRDELQSVTGLLELFSFYHLSD